MAKFKIGDRVKVVAVYKVEMPERHHLGETGTIVNEIFDEDEEFRFIVDVDPYLEWPYAARELELVEE